MQAFSHAIVQITVVKYWFYLQQFRLKRLKMVKDNAFLRVKRGVYGEKWRYIYMAFADVKKCIL